MIKRRNIIILLIVIFLSVLCPIVLLKKMIIKPDIIINLGNDFQFNIISTSAIIGGFLFTGISILISVIDKDRIKRLWDNNYLDNLYRAAFIGMISNVISIICALAFVCCDIGLKNQKIIVYIEITFLFVGIIFFLWCIKRLIGIISKLKSNK